MLPEVVRLLGVDLNLKFAEIRALADEFRARTTHQVAEQVKQTSLMIGLALVGAIAALATFIIVLVALYWWVDMYRGPFAALSALGVVMAVLATVMFMLAFGSKRRKPAFAVGDGRPTAAPSPTRPSPTPPPRPVAAALSDALPRPPLNASLAELLTHRFSTRVAGASDEAIDAAAHIVRTGSKSALFGTLAVVVLVGVLIGRRR